MKKTINGSTFEATTRVTKAPMDVNGNKRYDVDILVNGERLRDTIPGARKVGNGYRVQAYNEEMAVETALHLLERSLEKQQPTKNQNGSNRSTGKEVKEKIREHIMDNLSNDFGETTTEQLQAVVDGFINWYGGYERRRVPNVQQAFIDWLRGLPSELYATPYHEEQKQLLNEWLGKSPNNYTTEVMEHRFYYLIFREFNALCTKYNVKSLFSRL